MKKTVKQTMIIAVAALVALLSISINGLAETAVEGATDIAIEDISDEVTTDVEIGFDEGSLGDVNNDGRLTASDARLLLRCAARIDNITEYILTYGDYNKDNKITSSDARTALRVSASIEKIECILHGHDLADYVVAPTCAEEGYTTKKCIRCYYTDGSKKDFVPTVEHKLVSTTTKATCTQEGRYTSKCSVCGYTDKDYQVEAALGHSFSGWTQSKNIKSRSCKRCGFTESVKVEPVIIPSNEKTIYLTFDDGPGPYTKKLLGYLREYNVKATFFVTNQSPGYSYLLKNIVDDGHAIGVHSLTHEWSIYSSEKSYMKDFNAMHDLIKTKTGVDTKLFRFPGGTNNTVSRSYSRGIMTKLAKSMTDAGYVYFDWNVDCYDTSGYSSSQIVQTTINQIKGRKTSVVLMHDIRNTTVEAVKRIIEFGLDNGYVFRVLDENSPAVRFKPAN